MELASQAVEDATKQRDVLAKDVESNRAKLVELENAVANQGMQVDQEEGVVQTTEPGEMEQLREQLRVIQEEASSLREEKEMYWAEGQKLEQGNIQLKAQLKAKQEKLAQKEQEESEMKLLGAAALHTRLETVMSEHHAAVKAADWAGAAVLAGTTQKLTAALRGAAD